MEIAVKIGILICIILTCFGIIFLINRNKLYSKSNLKSDDVLMIKDNDDEMNEAITKAKNHLGEFRKAINEPDIMEWSVKIVVSNKNNVEFVWLKHCVDLGNGFKGQIDNEIKLLGDVKENQEINVLDKNVVDWGYLKYGYYWGHYTTRVLIKRMSKEARNEILKRMEFMDNE